MFADRYILIISNTLAINQRDRPKPERFHKFIGAVTRDGCKLSVHVLLSLYEGNRGQQLLERVVQKDFIEIKTA